MLSGQKAFTGPTPLDALTAILISEPPPLAPLPTAALEPIIRRAIAKEPAARFPSATHMSAALDQLTFEAAAASRPAASAETPSLAVLPFADLSPGRDHEYFCDGVAEEILDALSRLPGLRVASGSASFRFRGRTADLKDVGAALNARWLLEGSLRTAADRLRASVRLTDVNDGSVAWSRQFDRTLADVFAVQDEIARAVVDALQVTLGATAESRIIRSATARPDAYALYLKGRHHWSKRTAAELDASIACFEQALQIDPAFAKARAGLADACSMQAIYGFRAPDAVMPRARQEAVAAKAADDRLPEAHVALGVVRAAYEWSWAAAEAEFLRALEIAPDAPAARQAYANYVLTPLARFDEALVMLRHARDADPVSLPLNIGVAVVEWLAGRPADAVITCERTLLLDPHFAPALLPGPRPHGAGDHERALDAEGRGGRALSAGPEQAAPRHVLGAGDAPSPRHRRGARRAGSPVRRRAWRPRFMRPSARPTSRCAGSNWRAGPGRRHGLAGGAAGVLTSDRPAFALLDRLSLRPQRIPARCHDPLPGSQTTFEATGAFTVRLRKAPRVRRARRALMAPSAWRVPPTRRLRSSAPCSVRRSPASAPGTRAIAFRLPTRCSRRRR
jgi:serine/threonine-protein kinase